MKCEVCPKEIPPERLEVQPRTKTCSAACTKERQRRMNRLLSRKRREKRRILRQRKKQAMERMAASGG